MRGKALFHISVLLAFLLIGLLGVRLVYPQTFPDPATVLADFDVSVEVTFNPANGVYTYTYTLTSGPANLREIIIFSVDIVTKNPITPADDPDLVSDDSFRLENFAPTRTVPVGLQSPPGWIVGVGIAGEVGWGSVGAPSKLFPGNPSLFPGNSLGGFIIQSKAPPGPRSYEVTPHIDDLYEGFGDEIETMDVPQMQDYDVKGQTIGPVLPEELVLIDGKGQRPSDVNTFLRYSNPTETSVTLSAGVKTFDLAVFYGSTIDPASFRADLNREIITPKFTASPGGFSVVRLDLKEGRNTLVLSVDGIRSDGRTGRDTDRLTFIVPAP